MRSMHGRNQGAAPLLGEAMYVPEIRANGDEVRITVAESASASGSASAGSSP
ncbi:MAG TPA: hypothetical protein VM779_07405 [Thermoanaerobaculia bacterium]|nr:hypothetical protein [Thermoanaerobaculia bacterium]